MANRVLQIVVQIVLPVVLIRELRDEIPEYGKIIVEIIGNIQMYSVSVGFLWLAVVCPFITYTGKNMFKALCTGDTTWFLTVAMDCTNGEDQLDMIAVLIISIALFLQLWAAVRLKDSTREEMAIRVRNKQAKFWKWTTVGLIPVDWLLCIMSKSWEAVYNYGIPVTLARLLFLLCTHGYTRNLLNRPPFGGKQRPPSIAYHIKDFFKSELFMSACGYATFIGLFCYYILKPFCAMEEHKLELMFSKLQTQIQTSEALTNADMNMDTCPAVHSAWH